MKLTACCTDAQMFSKQVETNFEMILEECNMEKLILIGMPLEKLPLNCDGLPFIVQKIYDYIINYGLYEECLFGEAYSYSNHLRKANIINAYELVSGSENSCKTMMDVEAVDVATVFIMWLYYLPEPLISSKQFSMICDLNVNQKYGEIINSMDNISRLTLQRIMNIVDSYGKQHKSYKEKLGCLFTLLLTKHGVDNANQHNAIQFIDNLKIVLMEAEIENNMYNNKCLVIKENLNRDDNMFIKNNLFNKKTLFRRSLSDDELQSSNGAVEINATMKCNAMKKSSSCNMKRLICKENDPYSNSVTNNLSIDKDNSKVISSDKLSENCDISVCVVDEGLYNSQIDDMRNIERTMQTHSRSKIKRNKNKSIRIHVERILKSGFLSDDESLLLENTLELMKILSKIKNVQHQINIQSKNWEDGFGYSKDNANKLFPELDFLNYRLEQLVNQKNHYLTKTGLSYGRSYNRTVLNLKNAQKEAFKLHEDVKNQKNQNENIDKLISDIYNIQIVLDYLENNCGGKELPWRSSKGCPGSRRKTKRQLNCVTVVSDLQTISEHEIMETIPQPLFIPMENSVLL